MHQTAIVLTNTKIQIFKGYEDTKTVLEMMKQIVILAQQLLFTYEQFIKSKRISRKFCLNDFYDIMELFIFIKELSCKILSLLNI